MINTPTWLRSAHYHLQQNYKKYMTVTVTLALIIHALAFKFSPPYVPSPYQLAIFEFIQDGVGNALVEAVAGSGKTTTIVKALEITPKDARQSPVPVTRAATISP